MVRNIVISRCGESVSSCRTEARSGMFSFTTGTDACLASFDFARGWLARSNGESFAPLV